MWYNPGSSFGLIQSLKDWESDEIMGYNSQCWMGFWAGWMPYTPGTYYGLIQSLKDWESDEIMGYKYLTHTQVWIIVLSDRILFLLYSDIVILIQQNYLCFTED